MLHYHRIQLGFFRFGIIRLHANFVILSLFPKRFLLLSESICLNTNFSRSPSNAEFIDTVARYCIFLTNVTFFKVKSDFVGNYYKLRINTHAALGKIYSSRTDWLKTNYLVAVYWNESCSYSHAFEQCYIWCTIHKMHQVLVSQIKHVIIYKLYIFCNRNSLCNEFVNHN